MENLRRELIANMSHDLRTPLTMISGYGEVMRDIPGENTPENVQIIIDETKRLTNLVNDMLDLSKLQAGVQELNAVSMNLTDEIRSIIERYETLLKQDEYDIRFEYREDVIIQGDVIKLDQVIYNLINNAINYSGEDHQVIVKQLLEPVSYTHLDVYKRQAIYRRCLFKRGRNIYSHRLQHRYTACIVIGRQAYISGLSSTTKSNSMG